MAEEVKMEPVAGAEPPKVSNPLMAKPTVTSGLKPGLRLPPKPGATVSALKPGLKLPPKPGATVSALKPGLKLPPKPGATVSALKPGLKLPPKPVIHKPGAAIAAAPLPKPIAPAAAPVAEPTPAPVAAPAPAPVAEAAPTAAPVAEVPPMPELPKPVEQLKAVTQKLKSLTQEIPQQAILRKTGIVADAELTEAQKQAQKSKTSRISLSEAIGVAPVKNENAPMKTIRIKRPIDIPTPTKPLATQPRPPEPSAEDKAPETATSQATTVASTPDSATTTQSASTITQRKTLKISRPGVIRPSGKFGIKRPGATVTKPAEPQPAGDASAAVPEVADIPDMPPSTPFAAPAATPVSDNTPAWLSTLSSLVQAAACVAMGLLAWYLYTGTQTQFF